MLTFSAFAKRVDCKEFSINNSELVNVEEQDTLKLIFGLNQSDINLDDVRCGDYELCFDPNNQCIAVEELQRSINILLAQKLASFIALNVTGTYDTPTAEAVLKFRDWYNNANGESIGKNDDGKSWDQTDQLALEKALWDNYNLLFQSAAEHENKAMLKYLRGERLRESGNMNNAMKLYTEVINEYKQTQYPARAQASLGFIKYQTKEFQNSIIEYKKVINNYSGTRSSVDALYFLGKNYHYLEDNKTAEIYFNKILTEHPENKWVIGSQYFYAKCLNALDKKVDASKEFEKFINNYSNNDYVDDALFSLGQLYYSFKDFGKTIQILQKIITNHPNSDYIHFAKEYIAHCHYQTGQVDLALSEYNDLIQDLTIAPYRYHLLEKNILNIHYQKGTPAEIRDNLKRQFALGLRSLCERVMEHEKDNIEALAAEYYIAYSYYRTEEYQTAIERFNKLLTYYRDLNLLDFPGHSYELLGHSYRAIKDYDKAIEAFHKVGTDSLMTENSRAWSYFFSALCYLDKDKKLVEQTKQELQLVLSIAPSQSVVAQNATIMLNNLPK